MLFNFTAIDSVFQVMLFSYCAFNWFDVFQHCAKFFCVCFMQHVLLGLMYDEFNWEITEKHSDDGSEPQVSSLFLEFEDSKSGANQLLQIVSKEVAEKPLVFVL